MKYRFLLLTVLTAQLIIACSPAKESKNSLTADFFYGAWADSLKDSKGGEGIVLGKKNDFYFIWNGVTMGGDNFDTNIKLTYNLKTDRTPVEVELISRYVDTDSVHKKGVATIDVLDEKHIMWKMLDDNGAVVDSAKLTRIQQ